MIDYKGNSSYITICLQLMLTVWVSQSVTEVAIKFYSHQLMHFFIQICIGLLSYSKIT